jgi:hypothetical protein
MADGSSRIRSSRIQRFVQLIEELKSQLPGIASSPDGDTRAFDRLDRWDQNVITVFTNFGVAGEGRNLRERTARESYDVKSRAKDRNFGFLKECTDRREGLLDSLLEDVEANPEIWHARLSPGQPATPVGGATRPAIVSPRSVVFLGHGHNTVWARVQLHLQNDMHLKVEEWDSQPRAGRHTVEVLKGFLDACGFAVIVATAEDATNEGGVRARQNVVHEIGLFQGRLGFEKVAILMQAGVQELSNLAGLQVIPFSGDEVKAAFHDLDKMLRRERILQ